MPRRKLKDSVALLKGSGYDLPPGFESFIEDDENRKKGIRQIWECKQYRQTPAKHDRVELFVTSSGVTCKCGKACTKIWTE